MFGRTHEGTPTRYGGAALRGARAALILAHGRGANAASILELGEEIGGEGIALLAPEAMGGAWYPFRFIEPIARNEPYLTSALNRFGAAVAEAEGAGIAPEKIVLIGFSQGACLALEYAARNPRRYGGVIGLSGGLIGESVSGERYPGHMAGSPVLLGCSDIDSHIPVARVHESAAIFRALGATVDERIYPNMGHTVNRDEIQAVRALVAGIAGSA